MLRHSTAHVMAEAVQQLWPGTKVAIGPAIENGFYYDFEFARAASARTTCRGSRTRCGASSSRGPHTFERSGRRATRRSSASAGEGESYKVELAEGLPEGDEVTYYTQDGFTDLCRGPHLQTTAADQGVQADLARRRVLARRSSNPMLTRIYGTAFFDQAELDDHLERIEQARQRDHRRLGTQLDLFHFSTISPGSPFWHPNGMVIWNALTRVLARAERGPATARCARRSCTAPTVWKQSGHWDNYRENMFFSRGGRARSSA